MIGPFRVKPDAALPFTVNMAPAIPPGASIDSLRIAAYAEPGHEDVTARVIADAAPAVNGLLATFEYQGLSDGQDYQVEITATLNAGSPAYEAVEWVLLQCRR